MCLFLGYQRDILYVVSIMYVYGWVVESECALHFLLLLLLLSFLSYIVNIVCCRLQVAGCRLQVVCVSCREWMCITFFFYSFSWKLLETPWNSFFSSLFCIVFPMHLFQMTSDYVPLLSSPLLLLILLLMRMRMRMR